MIDGCALGSRDGSILGPMDEKEEGVKEGSLVGSMEGELILGGAEVDGHSVGLIVLGLTEGAAEGFEEEEMKLGSIDGLNEAIKLTEVGTVEGDREGTTMVHLPSKIMTNRHGIKGINCIERSEIAFSRLVLLMKLDLNMSVTALKS